MEVNKKTKKYHMKNDLLEINYIWRKDTLENEDLKILLQYLSSNYIISHSALKTLTEKTNLENVESICNLLMLELKDNSSEEFKINFIKFMKFVLKRFEYLEIVNYNNTIYILEIYKNLVYNNSKSGSIYHLCSYIKYLKEHLYDEMEDKAINVRFKKI